MKKIIKLLALTMALLILVSCSALNTSVSKRNLDVQTKMSNTIWLEPVAQNQKTIFLQIKNTSGKNLEIKDKIANKIREKGYLIVDDPAIAKYWLQANILKVDKVDLRNTSEDAFSDSVLAGGIGALLGGQRSGGVYTAIGWGLAAATVSTIVDSLVTDVKYAMVTDILITEKTGNKVTYTTKNRTRQGSTGETTSTTKGTSNVEKYSTRVLSIANKVNLKFNEAVPTLENELVSVIAGIF